MSPGETQLSRWQTVALQAVLPILLIGVALPLGLTALVLGVDEISVSHAVDHGELFLVGGNAAFTGCLVLVANRPDRAINAFIVSTVIGAMVIVPSYIAWALLATSAARDAHYSMSVAIRWGAIAAIAGLITALALVVYTFFIPTGARAGSSGPRSATLQR